MIGLVTFPVLALSLTGCPDNPTAPTLTNWNLSAGLLNPTFDPNFTTYETMFIGNTSVTVTPTATSGNTSGFINLPGGNTTITVAMTGPGGTTTYTITAHCLAQEAYAKASNTGGDDEFGYNIALSGDTSTVEARNEASNAIGINPGVAAEADNNADASGAVYVFQ